MAAPANKKTSTSQQSGQNWGMVPNEAANDKRYGADLRLVKSDQKKATLNAAERIQPGNRRKEIERIDRTRNVRTMDTKRASSMPGNPKNTTATRETVSDTFKRETYDEAGLRPASLSDQPRQPYQQPQQLTRQAQAEYAAANEAAATPPPQPVVIRQPKKKKPGKAKATRGRVKALAVSIGIWSWGGFSWAVFQVPLALLSLAFLGLAGLLDAFVAFAENDTDDGFFIETAEGIVGIGLSAVGAAVDGIDFLFGFDLSAFHPANFFGLTYLMVLCFGIFMLMIIFVIYKLSILKPLSGQGSSIKIGAFLLALIGYSIPLLNLFPWFLPWTLVTLKYPK